MVHLTPSVFRDLSYQRWCGGFRAGVDHVTLHAAAAARGNSPKSPLCTNVGGDDDNDGRGQTNTTRRICPRSTSIVHRKG